MDKKEKEEMKEEVKEEVKKTEEEKEKEWTAGKIAGAVAVVAGPAIIAGGLGYYFGYKAGAKDAENASSAEPSADSV